MKYLLLAAIYCMCVPALSQYTPPAGVANTYILTEKEGYNSAYYNILSTTGTGINYLADTYSNFYIAGNNYVCAFDTIKNMKTGIIAIKAISYNEAWAICTKCVVVFKNKKVYKVVPLGFEPQGIDPTRGANIVYFYAKAGDVTTAFAFDGNSAYKVPAAELFQPVHYTNPTIKLHPRRYANGYVQMGTEDASGKFTPFADLLFTDYILEQYRFANHGFALCVNKPFLFFPYLQKYPRIYDNNNADNIYGLAEDNNGAIYAGSHQNILSIISNNKTKQVKDLSVRYMNGGCNNLYNNHLYFIAEKLREIKENYQPKVGVVQVSKAGTIKQITSDSCTGFYTYITKNKRHFYFAANGSSANLWQTTTQSLETLHPHWNKIDSAKGSVGNRVFTITEDTLGRIWYGNPRRTLSMYNPTTDRAITWQYDKKETPFGTYSSLTDHHGTVWMGSISMGLWYYSNYTLPCPPR